MIIHTIIPLHVVADGMMKREEKEYIEIEDEGRTIVIEPLSGVRGRIVRLISTRPSDYLDPALQPGQTVFFTGLPLSPSVVRSGGSEALGV